MVSIDAVGRLSTVNAAAARLLDIDPTVVGQPAATVFERADLAPLGSMLREARRGALARTAKEVALAREGRECHLAVAATSLPGEHELDGVVMVFDDVTPLFRAQRVAAWRDVARRLAHEIKNPLTPIQLCAERIRRNLSGAPAQTRALVDECTTTIVGEVEALKGLVDEFSHFARLPSPRAVPVDLNALLSDTLGLYDGLFEDITLERPFQSGLPSVRVDPDQIQRVVVNLVDNAVSALDGRTVGARTATAPPGVIRIETQHDATNGVARVLVSDNGPGIADTDREKLGEFNWSSQHLDDEVLQCRDGNGEGQTGRVGLRCVRLVGRRQRGVRSSNGSGRRSRGGCRVRMPLCPVACRRPWVVVGSVRAVVCRRSAWRPDRLATCPLRSGKRSRSCELRAPGCVTLPVGSGEPRRLSRESYVATRRLGAAVWRIGRRLRSGTAPDVPSARR